MPSHLRRATERPTGRLRISPKDVRAALGVLGPCTWAELVGHLRPPRGGASRALKKILEALVDNGEVVLARRGGYRLNDAERVRGLVETGGDGPVLRANDGRVLRIRAGERVRPGDQVTALAQEGWAKALRIVEPSPAPVVGVLSAGSKRRYAEILGPDKRRIDLADPTTARAGAVVELRLVATADGGLEGRVTRVVEAANEAALAAQALLAAHGVPRTWSFDAKTLAVPATVATGSSVPEGRRDLRALPFATIDGADARDYDDAVFAEPRPRGGWRLVVAIADVAHYVRPGTALDRDARERGNSIYLPDRVVPMLPEALSNGICSLLPDQDRLVVVCDMRVSAQGRVTGYDFAEAVMRSRARLTYDAVDEFLRGGSAIGDPAVAQSLLALDAVRQAFRRRRAERGALDFDANETRVRLRDGRPVAVERVCRNNAHLLIEEAMIAANVAAARHLEQGVGNGEAASPPVYRVHEPPAADKLEALAWALRLVGEKLPDGRLAPDALMDVCRRARAKSSWPGWIWDAIVLRSLALARYEPRRLGHFGLALPAYAHFTSPIRRYADLLIHRMIKGVPLAADEADAVATHTSMTERRAEEVERGVDSWLKCVLAEARTGETCAGTVAAVTSFGLFVELDDLGVQGLLHVSGLGRDYYEHLPQSMSLVASRSGARFTLGDRLQVVIREVSVATGRIDLALQGAPIGRRRGRRR